MDYAETLRECKMQNCGAASRAVLISEFGARELSLSSFDCAQDARKEARIFGLIKIAGLVEENMAG